MTSQFHSAEGKVIIRYRKMFVELHFAINYMCDENADC